MEHAPTHTKEHKFALDWLLKRLGAFEFLPQAQPHRKLTKFMLFRVFDNTEIEGLLVFARGHLESDKWDITLYPVSRSGSGGQLVLDELDAFFQANHKMLQERKVESARLGHLARASTAAQHFADFADLLLTLM